MKKFMLIKVFASFLVISNLFSPKLEERLDQAGPSNAFCTSGPGGRCNEAGPSDSQSIISFDDDDFTESISEWSDIQSSQSSKRRGKAQKGVVVPRRRPGSGRVSRQRPVCVINQVVNNHYGESSTERLARQRKDVQREFDEQMSFERGLKSLLRKLYNIFVNANEKFTGLQSELQELKRSLSSDAGDSTNGTVEAMTSSMNNINEEINELIRLRNTLEFELAGRKEVLHDLQIAMQEGVFPDEDALRTITQARLLAVTNAQEVSDRSCEIQRIWDDRANWVRFSLSSLERQRDREGHEQTRTRDRKVAEKALLQSKLQLDLKHLYDTEPLARAVIVAAEHQELEKTVRVHDRNIANQELVEAQKKSEKNTARELARAKKEAEQNMAQELVRAQKETEMKTAQELARAKKEAEQNMAQELARVQKETETKTAQELARAQKETEMKTAQELARAKKDAEQNMAQELARAKKEAEQKMAEELSRAQKQTTERLAAAERARKLDNEASEQRLAAAEQARVFDQRDAKRRYATEKMASSKKDLFFEETLSRKDILSEEQSARRYLESDTKGSATGITHKQEMAELEQKVAADVYRELQGKAEIESDPNSELKAFLVEVGVDLALSLGGELICSKYSPKYFQGASTASKFIQDAKKWSTIAKSCNLERYGATAVKGAVVGTKLVTKVAVKSMVKK